MYITQGSGGSYSHKGTMANDVRGLKAGVRYPYYAPCDVECIWTYPSSGQAMWRSTQKVRFANGRIDYATFVTCHDDTFNAVAGKTRVSQGTQLGNMGTKGNATGVHCHIEIAQHKYSVSDWKKNKYGIYCFPNETDTDDCYFVDNTNILNGMGGSWKHTTDVPVKTDKYINIPPTIEERNIYNKNKQKIATIKPKKFGGLSYKIYSQSGDFVEIQTVNFGRCYVKKTAKTPITETPTYEHGNY